LRNEAARRGAHRKGADIGDARTESDAEEGLRWQELARRTPGRWGKRVRHSSVDGRDERQGAYRLAGDGTDARAPAGGGRGSEERGAGRAWASPEKCGVGRAWINSSI
jgi:hypothetical protein